MAQGTGIVVVGEALVDIVSTQRGVTELPGGSPANVALALGRRGRDVTLVTALGADSRGDMIREWLGASSVQVDAAPLERTSTALAEIGGDGAAHYTFDVRWTLEGLTVPGGSVLHHGSLGSLLVPGADRVEQIVHAARDTALITYDPNIRPSLIDDADAARDRVARHISAADVVKASDEDIDWLYPGADPQEIAQAWLDDGAGLVVVTAGAQGAFAAYRGGIVHVPAADVVLVDTVGAGDTAMAALIDALPVVEAGSGVSAARTAIRAWDDERIERILRAALDAAAITVSRPGADPPWAAELGS